MPVTVELAQELALVMRYGKQQRSEVLGWTLRTLRLTVYALAYWARRETGDADG